MNPKIEKKSIVLNELGGDGPGSFTGYASKFFEVDDYGDIVMPGAFLTYKEQFLTRGFTAYSHEWGYDGVIGYPVSAAEDAVGLLVETAFHSTPDAQGVRTKATERMAAGKGVFLSIGFICHRYLFIDANSYDTLATYIPADKLDAVCEAAEQYDGVRLLMEIELFEYSIVTAPACRSAEVIEVRSSKTENKTDPAAPPLAGVRFADELTTALAAVKAVGAAVQRGREIHAKRHEEKAGRTISAANRAALTEMHASMTKACSDMQDHCDTLKSFLDCTAPVEDEPKAAPDLDAALLAQSLRFQGFRAQSRGVLSVAS